MLKTKAIVLSSIKYGESSLILQMYTREEGRASFIISGIRKNKSKIGASLFQPGQINDMIAYYKPGDRLNRIKEIKPAILYKSIPFKFMQRAVCLYTIEVLSKSILEHNAHQELFDFIFTFLTTLDQTTTSVANYPIFLMKELSIYNGFGPHNNYSTDNSLFDLIEGSFRNNKPDHRHYIQSPESFLFHQLLTTDMYNNHELNLSRSERNSILNTLIDYFKIHIEGFKDLNSQKIFSELLGD